MNNNYAILIDGDNIDPQYCKKIFENIKELGNIIVKRVYCDFSREDKKSWAIPCIDYCIDSIQIWNRGKNATDMKIVTDCCFNVEKNHNVDNYVIVSGDGDFTILISSLKQLGKNVIGMSMSQHNTSRTLLNVCDRFIYLSNKTKSRNSINSIKLTKSKLDTDSDEKIENLTIEVITKFVISVVKKQTEPILQSRLKEKILRKWCDFDESNYNFDSFSKFIKSINSFEVIRKVTAVYVTMKE
jgi:hypothetical protein